MDHGGVGQGGGAELCVVEAVVGQPDWVSVDVVTRLTVDLDDGVGVRMRVVLACPVTVDMKSGLLDVDLVALVRLALLLALVDGPAIVPKLVAVYSTRPSLTNRDCS